MPELQDHLIFQAKVPASAINAFIQMNYGVMYAGAAICSKDNVAGDLGESSLSQDCFSGISKPLIEQMPWPRQHLGQYPRKETFQAEIQ